MFLMPAYWSSSDIFCQTYDNFCQNMKYHGQVITPTLPSPFPTMKAAGSPTRGRVWEGVKNGISYTIKLFWFVA